MALFQSFWHGETTPYERMCMKSFLDHGHEYVLYAYEPLQVPSGVEVRDANEILPSSRIFLYSSGDGVGSVSGFSNLFRYRLLAERGGWWVDTDVVCLSAAVPTSDIFLGWESDRLIGSAILKLPRGHVFARQLYEAADKAGTDVAWGEIGPHLITRTCGPELLQHVAAKELAYPIPSLKALQTLLPERTEQIRRQVEHLPFLHLWNEIFRRAVVFKWMRPPAKSFVGELFEAHKVEFASCHGYSEYNVQRLYHNYVTAFINDRKLELLRSHLKPTKRLIQEMIAIRSRRHDYSSIALYLPRQKRGA